MGEALLNTLADLHQSIQNALDKQLPQDVELTNFALGTGGPGSQTVLGAGTWEQRNNPDYENRFGAFSYTINSNGVVDISGNDYFKPYNEALSFYAERRTRLY